MTLKGIRNLLFNPGTALLLELSLQIFAVLAVVELLFPLRLLGFWHVSGVGTRSRKEARADPLPDAVTSNSSSL